MKKTSIFLIFILSVLLLVACGRIEDSMTTVADKEAPATEVNETVVGWDSEFGPMVLSPFETNTDITLNMFEQFQAGKSTPDEVENKVGKAHAFLGCGYIANVYFTADDYMVAVYYTMSDGVYVIDQIRLLNEEDGSVTIIVPKQEAYRASDGPFRISEAILQSEVRYHAGYVRAVSGRNQHLG